MAELNHSKLGGIMQKYLFILLLLIAATAHTQIIVNTEEDVIDAGDGLTSLREAVITANETSGQQTIIFNETVFLPGANRIIYLKSAIEITDESGVIIDGSSVKVTLDGSQADTNTEDYKNGLVLKSGGNTITKIYMQNFMGSAILIDSLNQGNNTIGPENWISKCQGSGISINLSQNNSIIKNNIWSNFDNGILVISSGYNTFKDNYIAVNELNGLSLYDDGGGNLIEGNQILKNNKVGLYIQNGTGNQILSNAIGKETDGIATIPYPDTSNLQNSLLKSKIVQASGSTTYGIELEGVTETEIKSNYINNCQAQGILILGTTFIDFSSQVPDTTYAIPDGMLLQSNHLENNGSYDIYASNVLGITIRENFMQYSSGGIYGMGLLNPSPQMMGRDSIDRGDIIIEDNILSDIKANVKIAAKTLAPLNVLVIYLNNLKSAVIKNNRIFNSYDGMYLTQITNLTVQSNTIHSVDYRGIDIYLADSSYIADNHLENVAATGIQINNGFGKSIGPPVNYVIMQDNILSNIRAIAVACTLATSLKINRNTLSDIYEIGISLANCDETNIEDNLISGYNSYAVYSSLSKVVNLVNNQISHSTGPADASVYLSSSLKSKFEKNKISGASGYGIQTNEVDTVFASNNQLSSNRFSGLYAYLAKFIRLTDNNFSVNGDCGAYLNQSDSLIIENNTFFGNQSAGLLLYTIFNALISNNYLSDNRTYGITVNITDTCVVQNNYIGENVYGYFTGSPAGQTLRFNTIQNNSEYGAYSPSDSLDARQNYWGNANGPAVSDTLYPGITFGDRINEYVRYLPFLTEPTVELMLKPVITLIDPAESSPEGGGSATLIGSQFKPGIKVYFGSNEAGDVQFLSSGVIKCTIPPGNPGTVDVIVRNSNNLADTLSNGFNYVPVVSVENINSDLPEEFALYANYPNPFNPVTHIRFALPQAADVRLEIFNTLGEKIETLVDNRFSAGFHTVKFDGSQFASGLYYYRIRAGSFTEVRRMLLMK